MTEREGGRVRERGGEREREREEREREREREAGGALSINTFILMSEKKLNSPV